MLITQVVDAAVDGTYGTHVGLAHIDDVVGWADVEICH